MNIRHSLLIAAAAVAGGATASAQAFTNLGDFSGGLVRHAEDITPDGGRIVGRLNGGGGFYWDWKAGGSPVDIGGVDAVAVSLDGNTILGHIDNPLGSGDVPAVYDVLAASWTEIPYPSDITPGTGSCSTLSGYDISNDGQIVTGLAWDGCNSRAFRWTSTFGSETLDDLNPTPASNRGTVCNDAGQVFGFAGNRTPTGWDAYPATSGTIWNPLDNGEVFGISADGGTILGSRNQKAFYGDTLGNFTNLPFTAAGSTEAHCASVGAGIIFGQEHCGPGCQEAFLWTPGTGRLVLEGLMAFYGITTGHLATPTGCSADGRIVIGSNPINGAWAVELPPAPLAQVYGCGTNPFTSISVISGAPGLGKVTVIGLDNPVGSQPAGSIPVLAIATQPDPNAPCGTPLPGFGMVGPAFTGELLINLNTVIQSKVGAPWAGAGMPSPINVKVPNDQSLLGVKFYAQGALLAPLNLPEIALTNALLLSVGT